MSVTSLEPESSASANSAISANHECYYNIGLSGCQHLFAKKFEYGPSFSKLPHKTGPFDLSPPGMPKFVMYRIHI